MREWLDHNGYAPRRFDCKQDGDRVNVSLDFLIDAQGEEFATRFAKVSRQT
jgi:hypothetical protein